MTLTATDNPLIKMGGNNPPVDTVAAPTPFELSEREILDLFDEAKNWADGDPVTTQEVHDEIEKLMDLIGAANALADKRRIAEVEPLNTAKDEIQTRYNALIGKTKTVTGRGIMALDVLKAVVEPFRKEKQRFVDAEAKRIRDLADAAELAAQQAFAQSAVGDLEARDVAETLAAESASLNKVANKAAKIATTNTGLTTFWQTEVTHPTLLARHYWNSRPEDVDAFFRGLAEADVRAGARTIPGCVITEQKKARA